MRMSPIFRHHSYQSLKASQFASLGGFLFGYDQGVISGILTMESFGAKFPRIYMDSGFKGWFTSTLLLSMFYSWRLFHHKVSLLTTSSCLARLSTQWPDLRYFWP